MTERKILRASRSLKSLALFLIATGLTLAANAQRPAARTLNPISRFRPQPASIDPDASTKLPKFLAHRDYLAADGPHGMATADLNGDGILDLVLNDGNTTGVSVLLGNRDGSFQNFALFGCGCQFPFDVVVADFNNDGKNDVAVTSPNGVSILLGDGAGNLGTPLVLSAGISPERLVAVGHRAARVIGVREPSGRVGLMAIRVIEDARALPTEPLSRTAGEGGARPEGLGG